MYCNTVGCPTLATPLFLSLGWGKHNANLLGWINKLTYSFFGITVDRKHEAKCLFPQEKDTLHTA
jgi:hypothetical protein